MMLSKLTIHEFIGQLGSGTPVPGGGSTSALSGALGIALIAMVANLTIGKPKYAEFEELNKNIAGEGDIRNGIIAFRDFLLLLCNRLISDGHLYYKPNKTSNPTSYQFIHNFYESF